MNRAVLAAGVIGALAGVQAPAHAQSIDYGALEEVFGEPVTTSATGSPQRKSEAPATMEIITAEDIRRLGADNIPDILETIAGVNVRRYGVHQADVAVRGYNQPFNPRLLVLINGRQVYLDHYGYTAWQALPVQLSEIRQIEVVKGPNSALYGFNAMSGVINIITYDPLLDVRNVVEARGGSNGGIGASGVATLQFGERAGLRLSGGARRADEFTTSELVAGGTGPLFDTPRQYSFAADGRFRLAPNVELAAEGSFVDSRELGVVPSPAFVDNTHRTGAMKLELTADTALGLSEISAYRNSLHYIARSPGSIVHTWNTAYVAQASNALKLGTNHTVRLGLEFRDNSGSGELYSGTIGYNVYAASGMWYWQILPQISLTTSLRVDHLALRYSGTPEPASPYTRADYDAAHVTEPSFNISVVYRLAAQDTVRVLFARGIQAPSLVDFGSQSAFDLGALKAYFVGNPDLSSSRITNYELGYDHVFSETDISLRANVYFQRTERLLASPFSTTPLPVTGGLVATALNVGATDAVGGGMTLSGGTWDALRWEANYSHITIDDSPALTSGPSSLNFEQGSPEHIINVLIGRKWGAFESDLRVHWQSSFIDQISYIAGVIEPFRVKSGVSVTLRLGYKINERVGVSVTGTQLNQSRRFAAASVPVERRVFATISLNFP